MNEWHAIKYMFSHRFKGAMAKFIVTVICTIVFDLTVAIVDGVGLGLILSLIHILLGHGEYDADTLKKEYERDLAKGMNPEVPRHYFRNDDPNEDVLVTLSLIHI